NGQLVFRDVVDLSKRPVDVSLSRQSQEEADRLFRRPPSLPLANDAAKDCITYDIEKSLITWNTSADSPIVKVALTYRNVCSRPVRARIMISSGHRPRNEALSFANWRAVDTRIIDREFAANSSQVITETLRWYRLESTMPVLRFPSSRVDTD